MTETIYIRLLDEGTDVWRPTLGRKLRSDVYEVLPTAQYDPTDERWEFPPGAVVRCEFQSRSMASGRNEKVRVAVSPV